MPGSPPGHCPSRICAPQPGGSSSSRDFQLAWGRPAGDVQASKEVGFLTLEHVRRSEGGSREQRAAQLTEHCCVMWLCLNPSRVCVLFSLRASYGVLNGHPSAPKVMSSDVTMRSFRILFEENSPGLTKNATWPKTRTSPTCPVPVQSGRESSFCSAPPQVQSSCAQAARDVILKQKLTR